MSPLAIPLGLLIALALGALGGGGSILTVPALVYALGQDPHRACCSVRSAPPARSPAPPWPGTYPNRCC